MVSPASIIRPSSSSTQWLGWSEKKHEDDGTEIGDDIIRDSRLARRRHLAVPHGITRVGRQTFDPQLAVGGFHEGHGEEEEEEAGVGHGYNGTDRKKELN